MNGPAVLACAMVAGASVSAFAPSYEFLTQDNQRLRTENAGLQLQVTTLTARVERLEATLQRCLGFDDPEAVREFVDEAGDTADEGDLRVSVVSVAPMGLTRGETERLDFLRARLPGLEEDLRLARDEVEEMEVANREERRPEPSRFGGGNDGRVKSKPYTDRAVGQARIRVGKIESEIDAALREIKQIERAGESLRTLVVARPEGTQRTVSILFDGGMAVRSLRLAAGENLAVRIKTRSDVVSGEMLHGSRFDVVRDAPPDP